MSVAFEWINNLLNWLVTFLPTFDLCEITHRGVKVSARIFKRGVRVKEIGPGLYWYWPRTTKVYTCSVVAEVYDLPTQSVDSKDGHAIMFSVSLVCRVRNVEKWLTGVENGEDIIKEVGAGAATDCIAKRERKQILKNFPTGDLEKELFDDASKALSRRYGVEVIEARLTDCCKHTAHRVEGGGTVLTTAQEDE